MGLGANGSKYSSGVYGIFEQKYVPMVFGTSAKLCLNFIRHLPRQIPLTDGYSPSHKIFDLYESNLVPIGGPCKMKTCKIRWGFTNYLI